MKPLISRVTGGAGAGVNGVEGATEDSEGGFPGRKSPVEVFGGDYL